MQALEDILFYPLFKAESFDFEFAPVNLILLALVVLFDILVMRMTRNYLTRILPETEFTIENKRITIVKLVRQVMYALSLVLAIQSFNVNNHNINFTSFLEFEIIHVNNFSFQISNILMLVVIFFVARLVLTLTRLYINRILSKKDWVDEGREYTIVQLAKYVIYTSAILIGVTSLGIPIGVIMASSAALFVGLGLGLQSIFADFVSGLILLFEGTVKVGDVVEADGIVARVVEINIRTSKIESRDGQIIIMPNSKLTTENVVNWSHTRKLTRFKVSVGVKYGSDTKLVKETLLEAAKSHPQVSTVRPPLVRFESFGDSALLFELFFWADKTFRIENVKSDLRFEIDNLFRERGIHIPFPQRDLHLVSDLREKSEPKPKEP